MFDLRYHAVSLIAVFLALIVGILVGVGMSDRGFLRARERTLLEDEIASLRRELEGANRRQEELRDDRRVAEALLQELYPLAVRDRLRGRRVALVFVGSSDGAVGTAVQRALADAGAPPPLRVRALKVPLDFEALDRVLARPEFDAYAGLERRRELGVALGRELVDGRETPLWDALAQQLVAERVGSGEPSVDGVVVARSADPQTGGTARFLSGFYAGLATSGVPSVGVERANTQRSALEAFRNATLSTVDSVDTPAGRLALVLLLAGGEAGSYGVGREATDGPFPPIASVPEPRG